jgi:parallel beta-helix repeat protein
MNIKKIRGNIAVSNIIGTVLLLLIAIIIFSSLLAYVLSSGNVSPDSPNLHLIGYVGENSREVIIEHRGGESPSLDDIKIDIRKGEIEEGKISISFDSDDNVHLKGEEASHVYFITTALHRKGEWSVGDYVICSFAESIRYWQVDIIIVDENSNSIIMSGTVNMGLTDYLFKEDSELSGMANFTWVKPATTSTPTQFTDLSAYPAYIDSWDWSFGDGNNSNNQNPLHSYAATNTYSVTLNVSYNQTVLGPDVTILNDSKTKQVDVYQPPNADFTRDIIVPQVNEQVQFNASSSTPTMLGASSASITRYYWDWDGDGIYDHDDSSHIANNAWAIPNTYSVTLLITSPMDGYSFNDTITTNVRVNAPPVADFTWDPPIPTYLDTINFSDTSSDSDGFIVNWTWDFDDGHISYDQNPSNRYPVNGTYNVSLTVMDNDDAIDTTIMQISVTRIPPVANFTYYPLAPETNVPLSFTDSSSDLDGFIVNWTWDFGDGNISYVQNPIHTYKINGTYPVSLTVTDNDSLTDIEFKDIVVNWREIWVNESWKGSDFGDEVAPGKFYGINAFDTIDEGVDEAYSGESVYVMNGYYEFTGSHFIDLDVSITLYGESMTGVTCYGTGNHPVMEATADDAIVRNFSFEWNSQTTSAITLAGNNILFENCYVETSRDGILFGVGSSGSIVNNSIVTLCDYGVRIEDASNHIIQNTTLIQCDKSSIYLVGASNINIKNCNISDSLQHGIHITGDSYNIIINSTDIYNNDENGILVENSDSITIHNNTVYNNSNGIYLYRALNSIISLNQVYINGDGINLEGENQEQAKLNLILDNIIHHNNNGVKFEVYAIENNLTCNTFHNNSAYGIEVPFESNKENDDNTFHHNNFIDNNVNAYDECSNTWDDEVSEGNYWDDYVGPGPYPIPPGANSDNYPLAGPV